MKTITIQIEEDDLADLVEKLKEARGSVGAQCGETAVTDEDEARFQKEEDAITEVIRLLGAPDE